MEVFPSVGAALDSISLEARYSVFGCRRTVASGLRISKVGRGQVRN